MPANVARKFVNQCGVLVKDNIPISIQRWKANNSNDPSVVPQREKDMLWEQLKEHFSMPEESENRVKDWAMKKIATQF